MAYARHADGRKLTARRGMWARSLLELPTAGAGLRTACPVKCVPKWRITLMFAQVRAVQGRVCKIADDSLPRFESWTCHLFAQVRLVRRPG